jgi:hypothetical protein
MAILFKAGFQEFTDFAKEKLKELSIQKMSADLFSGILEKDIFGRARKKYERDNDRGWAVDQYIPDTVFSKLPDFKYLSDKDQQAFYEILNDESMRTAGNSILNNDLSASGNALIPISYRKWTGVSPGGSRGQKRIKCSKQ